ncbi:MAG: hypothetical protein LBD24_08435 [Spirochaetaceae bacterium]|nr:hypothetical protein [Spirochaetaceae bacterium]
MLCVVKRAPRCSGRGKPQWGFGGSMTPQPPEAAKRTVVVRGASHDAYGTVGDGGGCGGDY